MTVNQASMAHVELPLTGLGCAACAARVERALAATPGVARAKVDLARAVAGVDFDPSAVDEAGLADAVRKAGYDVAPRPGR